MGEATARVFVAVEVPAGVRDRIAAAAAPLRRRRPAARWVTPTAYHLTLAFIGWADGQTVGAVESAGAQAAASVGPFALTLSGRAGTFGGRVLWADVDESPPLQALVAALRSALSARGLPLGDRPFHAHVTLARAGRGARFDRGLAEAYDGPASSWGVARVVLMRSLLGGGGARYSVEAAWLLGG